MNKEEALQKIHYYQNKVIKMYDDLSRLETRKEKLIAFLEETQKKYQDSLDILEEKKRSFGLLENNSRTVMVKKYVEDMRNSIGGNSVSTVFNSIEGIIARIRNEIQDVEASIYEIKSNIKRFESRINELNHTIKSGE